MFVESNWVWNLALFRFINLKMSCKFLDYIMPVISNFGVDLYLIIMCLVLLLYGKLKDKKYLITTVLVFISVFVFGEYIINFLKDIFKQPRPYLVIADARRLLALSTKPSFPSSHASNAFVFASVFGLRYKKLKWLLFFLAVLIAIARVYVGAHYPFDVIIGGLIGIGISYLFVNLFKNYI